METQIVTYCKINNSGVFLNGEPVLQRSASEDLAAFLGTVYKSIGLSYPKFFKMDRLCKLGILAAELVVRNTPGFAELSREDMALVFSNNASSLDTDRNHAAAIADKQNYFPSPSVFVYTLPNILTGEIALKHKITGENAFFVSEKFDAELMWMYCENLFREGSAASAICGWVDVDGDTASAFVYCIKNTNFKQENSGFSLKHNSENLTHLYSLYYGSRGNYREPEVTDH